ncbi:MAG: hypothetical protein V3T03_07710 [Candidatus Bipolaricaulota bacterium]
MRNRRILFLKVGLELGLGTIAAVKAVRVLRRIPLVFVPKEVAGCVT